MFKKGYEAMTIKDICDQANVGRSTFYAHYRSKDELRRSSFEHLRRLLHERQKNALAQTAGGSHRHFGFSLAHFEHAREHIALYRALTGTRGAAIALTSIRKVLCELIRTEIASTESDHSADSVATELTVQFVVGAYMAVLTWWLEQGAKPAPEEMERLLRRLLTTGVTT